MPIIKHSAIHVTPLKAIEYVINGEKTDDCKYVTGINAHENAKGAYEDFRELFEHYTGERFYKQSLDENRKERIRLHHYIQSFDKGEITPELAHECGKELAKKVFGLKYQVLVCTHVDKEHIHNHILLSAMDMNGKNWYDNKESIKRIREGSDKIARSHNLSVIENPKKGTMLSYAEYLAKQDHNSWKDTLRKQINKIILMPDVHTIDDLAKKLELLGYETSGDKYLHIRRKSDKKYKFMSTLKLGDGYGTEELKYRIECKNIIMPLAQVNSYSGIQMNSAFYVRQAQYTLFCCIPQREEFTYTRLRKTMYLLNFITDNNIHTTGRFENEVNSADEKYRNLLDRKKQLEAEIAHEDKVLDFDFEAFEEERQSLKYPIDHRDFSKKYALQYESLVTTEQRLNEYKREHNRKLRELDKLNAELEAAAEYRKEIGEHYRTYLEITEPAYERMKREMSEFFDFGEDEITETYKEDLQERHYFAEMYGGTVTEDTEVDEERLVRAYDKKYQLGDYAPQKNYTTKSHDYR